MPALLTRCSPNPCRRRDFGSGRVDGDRPGGGYGYGYGERDDGEDRRREGRNKKKAKGWKPPGAVALPGMARR